MPEINFHYEKVQFHQEVKVDGAIGGPSPTGGIAMSVYTERGAIPQVIVQNISDDGTLGEEVVEKRQGKTGVVRMIQVTLHMDVSHATLIRDWLSQQIEQVQQVQQAIGES